MHIFMIFVVYASLTVVLFILYPLKYRHLPPSDVLVKAEY